MPQGLSLPFAVSPTGGIKLVDSDAQDHKIIAAALSDSTNDNPFQQNLGMGPFPLFQVSTGNSNAAILLRLREIFDRFSAERRYELIADSVRVITADDEGAIEGEYTLQFKYLSIEANEEIPFSKAFSSNAAGQGS